MSDHALAGRCQVWFAILIEMVEAVFESKLHWADVAVLLVR